MSNTGINQKWADKKAALMGTRITIPLDGVIESVHFPDGRRVESPYRDNHASNPIVNGEEARRYLGKVGIIVQVKFQERHVQMSDGSIVLLLVTEKQSNGE